MQQPIRNPWNRLLMGSPLRRRPVAIGTIIVLALLLCFATLTLDAMIHAMRPEAAKVLGRSMLAASLFSLVPVLILWQLDRRERESPLLLTIAFLWGGLIATTLALPLNGAILAGIDRWVAANPFIKDLLGKDAALLLGAPVAGPLVEECTKGLGIVLLFWLLRAEYDNMRDGFLYGAMVGVGFNCLETPLYVAHGVEQFGAAPWELQLGARFALFGLSGHALFSGLFGASLGLARQTRRRWLQVWAPVLVLLLAIAAHVVNNLLPLIVTLVQVGQGEPPPGSEELPDTTLVQAWLMASAIHLVVFLPFFAVSSCMLWHSGRWERQVIREELAGEPADIVTPGEQAQIEQDAIFRTRRILGEDRRRCCALVNAQHELAFRKRRVRDAGGDHEADALVAGWREDIRSLRQDSPGHAA